MGARWLVVGLSALLALPPVARPQARVAADEVLLKAALVVKTFDHFAAACNRRRSFSADEAKHIDEWQRANGVAQIRARLPELEQFPAQKLQIDQGVATMVKLASARGARDCAAAVSLARAPDAQFAKVAPQLIGPTAAGAKAAPAAPVAESVAPRTDVPPSPSHAAVLEQIDGFAFNTRMTMGVGGALTTDTHPIVLFRNGDVLKRVEALSYPGGLDAHKRARPGDWSRWQRSAGVLQITTAKGWEKLPFQTTYPKLPDGLRLNGVYRRLGGGGTVGIGGGDSVAAWEEYRFGADGHVERGGGAGSRTETSGGSVVTQSVKPLRRGRYRVEGLLLHIDYDDGSREQRVLITDPKGPMRAIWLDGVGYVLRGGQPGAK